MPVCSWLGRIRVKALYIEFGACLEERLLRELQFDVVQRASRSWEFFNDPRVADADRALADGTNTRSDRTLQERYSASSRFTMQCGQPTGWLLAAGVKLNLWYRDNSQSRSCGRARCRRANPCRRRNFTIGKSYKSFSAFQNPSGRFQSANSIKLISIAISTRAILSMRGHRGMPFGLSRFERLKVVGSSPASLASPEGDMFLSAAMASRRAQAHPAVSVSDDACGRIGVKPLISQRDLVIVKWPAMNRRICPRVLLPTQNLCR